MSEDEAKKEQPEAPKTSVLEETKQAISDLRKEREEISKIKAELEQLRSEQLLSGTAGIRPVIEPAKEETPQEYANRIMSGKVPITKDD